MHPRIEVKELLELVETLTNDQIIKLRKKKKLDQILEQRMRASAKENSDCYGKAKEYIS